MTSWLAKVSCDEVVSFFRVLTLRTRSHVPYLTPRYLEDKFRETRMSDLINFSPVGGYLEINFMKSSFFTVHYDAA